VLLVRVLLGLVCVCVCVRASYKHSFAPNDVRASERVKERVCVCVRACYKHSFAPNDVCLRSHTEGLVRV
jgi:hypothetical protein